MSNPMLVVTNAGYGSTPPCEQAKFKPGDVVKLRQLKFLKHLPQIAAIAIVVPPGVPPEYAMADAHGRPRPLMVTRGSKMIRYIVGFEDDETPHLIAEKYLKPSEIPATTVEWTS